jgi:fibro-slime domain-containing protein
MVCNIWPYWFTSATFGDAAGCRGDQFLFPPSVAVSMGSWVTGAQGWRHDFWYTTETRYGLPFNGAFEIQVLADDDLFVFINGVLVIDLGGPHDPLAGRVQVSSSGMASITEGGVLDPTTGVIQACPAINPWTGMQTNGTCPGDTCDCRNRTVDLGLTAGRIYELAIFHAERHPTGTGLEISVTGVSRKRSTCTPTF